MKPVSPVVDNSDALVLSITADGNVLDSNLHVMSVAVSSAVNAVAKARLVLLCDSRPDESFFPAAFEALEPGKAIEIHAGYGTRQDAIFSGIVFENGIELAADRQVVLVDAAAHAVTMTASRKTALFTAVTDSALIERLISSNGLTPDVTITPMVHDAVPQNDATDWEFIVQRAGLNGMLVTTDARTVTVKAGDTTQPAILTVTYGESIVSLKAATTTGQSPLHGVRGEVSFQGSALARPGAMIELAGVGQFSGNVLVNAVHHDIRDGKWATRVEFESMHESPKPAVLVASSASGPIASMRGLQRGVVKQVFDEPAGAARVLVALPLGESTAALSARLASPYASESAGMVFYPEVGDEVIVGFLNDDPRFPIMLGSVHGPTPPPFASADGGTRTKGIVTRSKLELHFDDTDRVITLRTPGDLVVSLNDTTGTIHVADAKLNSVTLASSGIEINSASNLAITATGQIEVKAGGGLALQAKGALSCQGLRVDLEAETAFRAHGQATADLVSTGVVTVQGALVKIN